MYDIRIEFQSEFNNEDDNQQILSFKDKPFSFIVELISNYRPSCNSRGEFSVITLKISTISQNLYIKHRITIIISVDEKRNYVCSLFFDGTRNIKNTMPNKNEQRYKNLTSKQLIELLKERYSYE